MRKHRLDKSDGMNGCLFEPPSQWSPPTSFPNLVGHQIIGIDVETNDPHLNDKGPGFIRGDAKVAGIAIAVEGMSWYFPIGHLGGGNLDFVAVTQWLRDQLKDPDKYICGANLQYELEALWSLGIDVKRRCLDIQVAEALIDEEQKSYSLETVCHKYLKQGKDEALLRDAASAYNVDPKSGLWKLPSKYVGPYAEFDASSTLRILQEQMKTIKAEKLEGIFELESKLLPILWEMRKQGIPINMPEAEKLNAKLLADQELEQKALFQLIGYHIDPWSGQQIARLCSNRGIAHPTTDKGNPSFTGEWLESFSDPAIQQISKVREIDRMRNTFVKDWIFGNHIKGRIHPQWKQLASDDGGTRTGRMACANPNAQQVPASKYRMTGEANEFGKAIRALFHNPAGKWAKFDYSQQEPRILTHFAALCDFTGAKIARMAYQDNPKMDFYQYMVEVAGIDRRPAKDMYLGRCYGMGKKKMAVKLGKTVLEAEEILRQFDEMLPFVKEIADSCDNHAQQRGYVKTLLGRKRHFNYWEPSDTYQRRENGEYIIPLREDAARLKWPKIRLVRADTRKALNSLIQGSAADMTKAAIVKLYETYGVVPYMQVHDELDIGVDSEATALKYHDVIEHCVDMTVPVRSDMTLGSHWK